jgi:hypothetical protein
VPRLHGPPLNAVGPGHRPVAVDPLGDPTAFNAVHRVVNFLRNLLPGLPSGIDPLLRRLGKVRILRDEWSRDQGIHPDTQAVGSRATGWFMLHRRLAHDYETLPARSEAMIHLAMTDLMVRRVTGEATISGATRHHRIKSASRDKILGENGL